MNKKEMIKMMLDNNDLLFYNKKDSKIRPLFMNDLGIFSFRNEGTSAHYADLNTLPTDNWEIYTPTLTWEQAYEEMKKGKICQMVGTNRICRWNNKLETKSQENEWIPEIYLSVNSAYSSKWQLVEDEQDKKYSILDILKRFDEDKIEKKYILHDNRYEREIGSTINKEVAISFLTNENFYLDENDKEEFIKIPLKNREVATTEPFYVDFSKEDFLESLDNHLFNEYQDFEDPWDMGDTHYQKIIKDEEFQKRLNDLFEYLNNNHSDTNGAYTYNWLSLEDLRGKK